MSAIESITNGATSRPGTRWTVEVRTHNPITDRHDVFVYDVHVRDVDEEGTVVRCSARCVKGPHGLGEDPNLRARARVAARRAHVDSRGR